MNKIISGLLAAISVFAFAIGSANAQVTKVASPTDIVAAAAPEITFTGDICGNNANVAIKAPDVSANADLKKFLGVHQGKWNNNLCTGLAVTEVKGNVATVQYFYGAGAPPNATVAGSFVKTDAVMKGKYLFFKSMKGYDVSYELAGGQLKGYFGDLRMDGPMQKLR